MSAMVTTASAGETYQPPAEPVAGAKRRRWVPYVLLVPGGIWLLAFFVLPLIQLFQVSLLDPTLPQQQLYFDIFGWQFYTSNYVDNIQTYLPHILRSLEYSLIATVACLLIGYPLAYAIAIKAGRWKNLMLVGVIAPFFTSFLVRTLAWQAILSDHGYVVRFFQWLHILGPNDRLLDTSFAVIAGLTYNFLPFMVLPLYASLEKLDTRLLEASGDLYASPTRTFLKVTLPLSMPGLVSGTLMTFIPATGDYINAELLGSTADKMIGNVIQSRFFASDDYQGASALSFVLMLVILIMVMIYVRRAGTEDLS